MGVIFERISKLVKEKREGNGFYLVIFFVIFISALLIASVFKVVNLYKSSYFITNSYTLLVSANDPYILRLDTERRNLSILHIKNGNLNPQHITDSSIQAAVPIHASIVIEDYEVSDIKKLLSSTEMLKFIIQGDITLNQLNEFDVVKFMHLASKVPTDNITIKEIDNYTEYDSGDILNQIQDELYELFRDPDVINERVSIEIVNATSTNGLATSISQMLENGGYNIVAIRSGNTLESQIQTNIGDSETLKHITKIFPYPVKPPEKNSVSDIRIIVGADQNED